MKKLLTLVLALTMLLSMSVVVMADATAFVVSDATAVDGVATVEVALANNPGITSLGFYIEYDDSAMKLTGVKGATMAAGGVSGTWNTAVVSPYPSGHLYSWGNDIAPENYVANETILTLTFTMEAGVAAGDYYVKAINTTEDDFATFDYDYNWIDFATGEGKVTVAGAPEVEKVFTVAAPVFDGNVATCAVVNTEDTAKDIILVVAEYKDNELVALNVSDAKSIAAGTESATLTAAYTAAGSSAKAFVLNNLTDCIPYVAAVAK